MYTDQHVYIRLDKNNLWRMHAARIRSDVATGRDETGRDTKRAMCNATRWNKRGDVVANKPFRGFTEKSRSVVEEHREPP